MSATTQRRREVTVVYTIEDESTFRSAGNPLRYEHHGLKSHTISVGDCVLAQSLMEEALQRISQLGLSDSKASKIAQAALDAENQRITEALE